MKKKIYWFAGIAIFVFAFFMRHKTPDLAKKDALVPARPPEVNGISSSKTPLVSSNDGRIPAKNTESDGAPPLASQKVKILNEILLSKNDNDSRLDTEFKNLSMEQKLALRNRYGEFLPERLNEKGTVVFLLGRNIRSLEDIKFFDSVLAEEPCKSLANCASMGSVANSELDHEGSEAITLAYPQIVSLKALENVLSDSTNSTELKSAARKALLTAINSQNALVADMSRKLQNRFRSHSP